MIYIDHKCYECDFEGELPVVSKKVECPKCNTMNDVWFEGELPPEKHR